MKKRISMVLALAILCSLATFATGQSVTDVEAETTAIVEESTQTQEKIVTQEEDDQEETTFQEPSFFEKAVFELGCLADTYLGWATPEEEFKAQHAVSLQTTVGIIPRTEYEAEAPRENQWGKTVETVGTTKEALASYYNTVVIHHTNRPKNEKILKLQEACFQRGFQDFEYHYAINAKGEVYEARELKYKGEHVENGNSNRIGIVLMGNFTTIKESGFLQAIKDAIQGCPPAKPTEEQLDSLEALLAYLDEEYGIPNVKMHKDVAKKESVCPGISCDEALHERNLLKG